MRVMPPRQRPQAITLTARDRGMKRIAHISDLHFGRVNRTVVKGLLADLQAEQPHLIVVSGDLTQHARRREFRAAAAFLRRLPAPYLVIPGNHDIPPVNLLDRFTRPLRRYRKYISRDLAPLHHEPGLAILGLNTARPYGLHWNWAHGRLSHDQIDHVRAVFGGLPKDTFRILVTHHPFMPPPDAPLTRLVGRARRAVRELESCGVDLVMAGHLHRMYQGELRTHYPALRRTIMVVQASTATSTRLREEPNAYNLILIDGSRVGFQVRDWDSTAFRHRRTVWYRKQADLWIAAEPEPPLKATG